MRFPAHCHEWFGLCLWISMTFLVSLGKRLRFSSGCWHLRSVMVAGCLGVYGDGWWWMLATRSISLSTKVTTIVLYFILLFSHALNSSAVYSTFQLHYWEHVCIIFELAFKCRCVKYNYGRFWIYPYVRHVFIPIAGHVITSLIRFLKVNISMTNLIHTWLAINCIW